MSLLRPAQIKDLRRDKLQLRDTSKQNIVKQWSSDCCDILQQQNNNHPEPCKVNAGASAPVDWDPIPLSAPCPPFSIFLNYAVGEITL